ncbi:hypothetical protein AJ78_02858 [Emergomyces pasteurianus Ep9510]|uniref:Ferric oxidoreductase domain-containing protein n=1 Tax=Emergomyces pasteurianus Ep9510 TaxID=1447872 RepID=A0A1J9PLN9_9EURO|nr:hypothetical protein AJ78_02858 [Emergomyces pasteurianus Ep9510]
MAQQQIETMSSLSTWLPALWPYRYTSPTPEELRQRRELLTLRGEYAQLSTLILLLMFSVYSFAARRRTGSSKDDKWAGGRSSSLPLSAWLESPLMRDGTETRGQYLVATVWMMWLFGLSAWRAGDDYLHLTKSLAHTALATIPFSFLLSPKLSPTAHPFNLICSHLLHVPQTHLTPYHRLLGRLVIPTLVSLHSFLYIMFFVQNGLLEKRLNDADVQLGIFAFLALAGLWGASGWVAGWARGKRYSTSRLVSGSGSKRAAYVLHVVLVLVVLGTVYFHVEYSRRYVVQALVIYGVDVGSWVIKQVLRTGVGGMAAR